MATNLDVRFEEALAKDTQPARVPRRPDALAGELERRAEPARVAAAAPRGSPLARAQAAVTPVAPRAGVAISGRQTPSLPDLGPAPEFTGTQQLVQHPGRAPADARRRCAATSCWSTSGPTRASTASARCRSSRACTPPTTATASRSSASRRPSSPSSRRPATSQQAIQSDGLRYPVVQDNHYGTWNAYQNQYWPAEYLIDARGQVRHTQFGEGDYKQDEAAVRAAALRGRRPAAAAADDRARDHPSSAARHARDLPRRPALAGLRPAAATPASHVYAGVLHPPVNEFAPARHLDVSSQSATPVVRRARRSRPASRPQTSTW